MTPNLDFKVTEISQTIQDSASYYGRRIGNHTQALERYTIQYIQLYFTKHVVALSDL